MLEPATVTESGLAVLSREESSSLLSLSSRCFLLCRCRAALEVLRLGDCFQSFTLRLTLVVINAFLEQ